MKYCVRDILGNRILSNQEGISYFDTIEDAKMGGIWAGSSFAVVEDECPHRQVVFGLNTGDGFLFLDGMLPDNDISSETEEMNEFLIRGEQNHSHPLV